MENQIPKDIVQERFERLVALQDRISAEENHALLGTRQELLVLAQAGAKAHKTGRLTGRAPDHRLVHFSVPANADAPRPGDVVTVPITEAKGFHLISDPASARDYELRRSRAGDAWDRSQAESCGVGTTQVSSGSNGKVSIGMPSLRVPSA